MDFKHSLYQRYLSSHVLHRVGRIDREHLEKQSRIYRQHFGQFLPEDRTARIADLGCGFGSLLWWLRQLGYRNIHGVDASPEQVNAARALNIEEVIRGDVFEFLNQAEQYDLLFARDLLEHFDRQTVFDFLRSCHRGLRPGGRLVLQVPNAESPYFGRVRYGDFTHELAFTGRSLRQLLLASEFDEPKVYPWRPGITGIRAGARYAIWRLLEPLLMLPILIESGSGDWIVTMNLIASATKRV